MFLDALKQHHNWVAWQLQKDGDRLIKFPIDVKTGRPASCDNPSTWADYAAVKDAVSAGTYDSIGFALTKQVGLVIVDFDKVCLEPGQFPAWVRREIDELDSYTEISASGRGAHVLVWASVPENYNRQAHNVEIWGHNKMFALSENIYDGRTTIQTRDVSDLHRRINRGAIGPTYNPKLTVERYSTPKYHDLANDEWEKHGFASRSEASMSVLSTLAAKHNNDPEAIRREFETTKICAVRIEQGKWPRLADKEIERAIGFAREKQPLSSGGELEFRKSRVPGDDYDFVVAPKAGFEDGWFPRGDVSIIAGSSGVGKSTFALDLLEKQFDGDEVFGRVTLKLPYLVLLEDRGERALRRTLKRMRIDVGKLPYRRMPDGVTPAAAVADALDSVDPTPAAVFLEGMDLAAGDAKDMHAVSAVLKELSAVADHYHCAIIGSMGSPKRGKDQQYVAKRDTVIGSTAWSRKVETIVVLQKEGGKETDEIVTITAMPRNAPTEEFRTKFENGRLVDAGPEPTEETQELDATALANWARPQLEGFVFHDVEIAFPGAARSELKRLLLHLEAAKLVRLSGKIYVPTRIGELGERAAATVVALNQQAADFGPGE